MQSKFKIILLAVIQIACVSTINGKAQAVSILGANIFDEIRINKLSHILKKEMTTQFLLEKEYRNISNGINHLKLKHKYVTQESLELGDSRDFFVRNIRINQTWITKTTTLAYKKENINLWVETSAYDSLKGRAVFNQFLSSMEVFLFEKTSGFSINPENGILSILKKYAGEFPNVDGDDVLDIILLDIEDDFEESGSFVAGFFDPVNLIDHEYSNKRDIIYLDLYPTLIYQDDIFLERTLSTLTHEAQHLIHAGYEGNQTETVFANEGFSEALEIIAGFIPRSPENHFQSPLRNLISWNYNNPLPDYSRASLWTHYLIEQFGAEILTRLIQNPKVGIVAYSEEIESLSSLSFNQVFQNWGIALSVNNKYLGSQFGYNHPERKDAKLQPIYSSEVLPSIINGSLPDLTHALISYPLSREIIFEKGKKTDNSISISSFSLYPEGDGTTRISKNLQAGDKMFADTYDHGSISVLLSNYYGSDVDTSFSSINLKADGLKSGIQQKWRYGDGINDTFYLNASYLTLDSPDQKLGIIFPPNESGVWLESITVKNVFLSELMGTGVDGTEKRDFELEIFSIKNRIIDKTLIPKQYIEVQREMGKLVKEDFSLTSFYDQLSSVKDSILIVIGNDMDDQNYIALGMDMDEESNSMYYGNEHWDLLSNKNIGGNTLQGWNPMIEANVVVDQKKRIQVETIGTIQYDFNKVSIWVNPEFEHDTGSVSLIAKLPNGSFETGELFAETIEGYQFTVPVQVDGEYQFIANYSSGNGEQFYISEMKWSIEIPGGFLISDNYPNPFNPSTNILFTLIERGEVSWEVFDLLGRSVSKIQPELFESGQYSQAFNLEKLASGMYIIRASLKLERNNRTINKTKKVMLIK